MQHKAPDNYPAASDEVDIKEVFAAIGRFFSRIGNSIILGILRVRQVTRRYAWLIIACMLIGAGIGYFSYKSFEPYFSSELTISSRYYSSEMLESAVEELNQLAGENSHVILAKKLKITPEQAAVIRSFRVEPVTTTKEIIEVESLMQLITPNDKLKEEQLEDLKERLLADFNTFRIITTVYDLSILDPLEEGIVVYLTDNDYIRRRVSIEQENLIAFRDKLRQDQEQLNRLKTLQAEAYKRIAETGQTGSNNVIFGTPETANAPLNVYVQDLDFSRELIKVNERIELNRGLEIVSGFTPYGSPASLSLRDQLIVGALIGMGVAYLVILLIGINHSLNRYEARHMSSRTKTLA